MGKSKRFLAMLLAVLMILQMVPCNAPEAAATQTQPLSETAEENIAAVHTDDPTQIVWEYTNAFTGTAGGPAGELAAYWTAEKLYVGVGYSEAESIQITLGGHSVRQALSDASGDVVIEIPLADAGIVLKDYNQVAAFTATLTGAAGTASISNGTLHFALPYGDKLFDVTGGNIWSHTAFTYNVNTSNNCVYFNNITSDAKCTYTDTSKAPNYAAVSSVNAAAMSHSKDLYMEQTLYIEALPVKDVADNNVFFANQASYAARGLSLMLGNRSTDTEMLIASVQNVGDGKLALLIASSDKTSAGTSGVVDLGVKVGDTFTLGLQWNADDSVDVYVDDVYMSSVANVTRKPGSAIASGNYAGIRYSTLSGNAVFTVSDWAVYEGKPASITDTVAENAILDAVRVANSGVNLSSVVDNLVLPQTYADTYLSNVEITWESSNTDVIAADGTVTRPAEGNTDVTLTAKAGVQALGAVDVTVKGLGVALSDYDVLTQHTASGMPAFTEWPMAFLTNNDTPTGGLNTAWDKDNLYLSAKTENAVSLSVSVGDVAPLVYDIDASGKTEVAVAWADLGIVLTDYNQKVPVQAVITDSQGQTAQIAKNQINLVLTVPHNTDTALKVIDENLFASENYRPGVEISNGVFKLSGEATEGFSGYYAITNNKFTDNQTILDHVNRDIYWQQTLKFNHLPESEPLVATTGSGANGFGFYLSDRDEVAKKDYALYCSVHNVDGELVLLINGSGDKLPLGKGLGETFTLVTQWNRDNSIDVYVDGFFKGSFVNGGSVFNLGQLSHTSLGYRYATVPGIVDVDITASVLYEGVDAHPKADVAALLGDVSAVEENMTLPTSCTDPYLGTLAITWESSNTNILGNDGTVTRPAGSNKNVVLTAKSGNVALGSATVTVVRSFEPVDDELAIGYAADASAATDFNYGLDFVGSGGATGLLGAYWNKDTLYVGVRYTDAAKLRLTLGSYDKTIDLNPASGDTVVQIPMSETGLTITDLNQVLQLQAVLTDAAGGTVKLAKTFDKLHLTIPNNAATPLKQITKDLYASAAMTPGFVITGGDFKFSGTAADGFTGFHAMSNEYFTDRHEVLDHINRDLYWQQTMTFNALPESEPAVVTTASAVNGFSLYINDRYDNKDNTMLCAIHNVAGNLVLFINGSNSRISLNKGLGETFTLGIQWNRDESIDVYVDGILKGSFENATTQFTFGQYPDASVGYRYYNLLGAVDADITDSTVSAGIPACVAKEMTPQQLLGGVDLDSVKESLTLPTTFTSQYLGAVDISWSSSDTSVLANDGAVIRPQGADVQVQLSAGYNGKVGFAVPVTVKREVSPADDMAAVYAGDPGSVVWDFQNGIRGSGNAPKGAMAACWNKDHLVLAVEYGTAQTMCILAAGKQINVDLVNETTATAGVNVVCDGEVAVVTIPMQTLGLALDYNLAVDFVVKLTNTAGTAVSAADGKGKLHLTIPNNSDAPLKVIEKSLFPSSAATPGFVVTDGNIKFSGTAEEGFTGFSATTIQTFTDRFEILDHINRDLYWQQTMTFNALPESAPAVSATGSGYNGLCFYICDRYDNQDHVMMCTIHNVGGKLVLFINGSESVVELNKGLGETFTLATQWNRDESIDVYVDGILKGSFENATTHFTYGQFTDATMGYRYYNLLGTVDADFTDITLSAGVPACLVDEITKEAVLGDTDLSCVTSDLPLSDTYASDYLGAVDLVWQSSDPNVIATDGTVKRPLLEDAVVTLTLNALGGKLWSVEATVDSLTEEKLDLVKAYHTTEGGQIPESYTNGIYSAENAPVGKFSATWDKDNLYIALNQTGANSGMIYINGKQIGVTITGQSQVITVAWKDAGVDKLNYNMTLPMRVTLTGASGTSESATAAAGKLAVLIPVEGSFNVGMKTNGAVTHHFDADRQTGKIVFDTVTNANGNSTMVSDDTNAPKLVTSWDKEFIDHDVIDLMLRQTICVDAMPVTVPAFSEGAEDTGSNGLSFFIGDRGEGDWREVRIMLASINNTDKGLVLSLRKADGSIASVVLNKTLGQTFVLGTQWNKDDTVDVYVDDLFVQTVENATRNVGSGQANHNVSYQYDEYEQDVRITITEAVVGEGIPLSKADEMSAMNLLGTIAFEDVRSDITLPTSYESKYLGTYSPIVWTSSNTAVLSNTGKVTRPDGSDVTAVLTATYQGTVTCKVPVEVKGKAVASGNAVHAYHNDGQLAEGDKVYTVAVLGADGKAVGGIGASWDKDQLYLYFDLYAPMTKLAVKAGNKTVSYTLAEGELCGTKEIPMQDVVDFDKFTYNMSVALEVSGENAAGDKAATAAGTKLFFRVAHSDESLYAFPDMINTNEGAVYNVDYTTNTGVYVFDTEKTIDAATSITHSSFGKMYFAGKTRSEQIDHYARDLLLEQTVRIDAMPSASYKFNRTESTGLTFYLIDRVNGNGANCQTMYASIVNENGSLVLHLADTGKSVKLNKGLGETFRLGVQWNMNDSVDVYVDGLYVASVENVTYADATNGNDNVTYTYNNILDSVKITVTDVAVYDGIPVSVPGELLAPKVLAGVNIDAVVGDMTLPDSYESPYIGTVTGITWKSENPLIITDDGKVTRPDGVDAKVGLSAYFRGQKLWTVTAVVIANAPVKDMVSAINVNGTELADVQWNYTNGFAGSAGTPRGDLAAVWAPEKLYVNVRYTGAATLNLYVGSKNYSYPLEQANGTMCVEIPLSDVMDISDLDYNVSIPFYATLTNPVGTSATAKAENGTLCFVLPVDGQFIVAQKVNASLTSNFAVGNDGEIIFDGKTNANGATTITQSGKPNALGTSWDKKLLDHDENDVMLHQNIYVEAMPVTVPAFANEKEPVTSNGLTFYFGDRGAADWKEVRMVLCSLNNTDKGLVLLVGKGDGSAETVVLNKKVGQEFTLGTQWNRDDSLDIYVDGAYLKTVQNVTRIYTAGQCNYNLYYRYGSNAGDVRVSISDAMFCQRLPVNLADEMLPENMLAAYDLDAIRTDLPIGPVYDSPFMGAVQTAWTSSDPSVIDPNTGKVTRSFEKDVQVTLSVTVRGVKLWTRTVTVKRAHEDQSNRLTAMYTYAPVETTYGVFSDTDWNYTNGIVGETHSVYGNVAARWDKDAIYLGMEYAGAKTAQIAVNGKTVSIDLVKCTADTEGVVVANRDGRMELVIPMSAISLRLLDYEVSVKFRITLSDGENEAYSSSKESNGTILFTMPDVPALYMDLGQEKPDLETVEGSAVFEKFHMLGNNMEAANGKLVISLDDNASHAAGTRYMEVIKQNRNPLLEQTIRVDNMPQTQVKWIRKNTANGYYFYVADKAVNPNTSSTSSYCRMVYSCLQNVDGKLVLVVNGGTPDTMYTVDLGVGLGETFRLGTLWRGDDSFTVYVNGKEKATFEDMTFTSVGYGQDSIMLGYADQVQGQVDMTVSDITLTYSHYTSIGQEANAVEVFGDQIPTLVEDDIQLPTKYTSAFLGELSIGWKSAMPEYLSASGKVNRPADVINGINVDMTAYVRGGGELFTIDPLVKSAAVESISLIQVPFTEEEIVLDGVLAEQGWSMNTHTRTEGGKQTANFGVQWDLENLYMAVDTANIYKMDLSLGEQKISLGKSGVQSVTKGDITEIRIPLENLGIEVKDYGVEIPISVSVGDGVFEGTLKLTSIDWFSTDSVDHRVKVQQTTTDALSTLGSELVDNGFYMYDHFDDSENGINYGNSGATTMVLYSKKFPGIMTVEPLWPVDETYYMSFDFQAESMPVYTAAVAAPNIRSGAYGLSFYVSSHRNGLSADNPNEVVLCGIYNSGENGLMLVVSAETCMEIMPLNRHVGDLFRIAVACDPEGDATFYVDGEQIGYVENAEKQLTGMCSWGEDGCVNFSMRRSTEPAKSAADNFDIYITNYAFGLYYGEELLDSLTFDEFGEINCNQYRTEEEELAAVTFDISILEEFANDQLTNPTKLSWESSHPDIVSPKTGKVNRPEKNGQLVQFTATTESGRSKTFDMFVKGLDPEDTYLYVYRDIGAYQNPGEVLDAYTFTLDEHNSSIIYNLKSKQPVNVVKLTDGDDTARLHTDFMQLFVSDDNVTYTEVKDFKLLQRGCEWYLYDFEAEGQYVKVHTTYPYDADSDFEGLLQGFITAYHEDVFGQGEGTFASETEYVLTNDTGMDLLNEAWHIAASELGDVFAKDDFSDARFYLNGKLLYHYYEDGDFVVRIPEFAKGDSVKLTIKSGNASAMDIANKEYVHEIIYGLRETWSPFKYFQNRIARSYTFEDGTVIGIDNRSDGGLALVKQYSYDGGVTFTKPEIIQETNGLLNNVSGFFYDDFNDRVFVYGHNSKVSPYSTHMVYTEDQGATWVHMEDENGDCGCPKQGGSCYVNGLTTSVNDGEGPNVDFVVGMGTITYDSAGARNGLLAQPWISKDGGRTWYVTADMYAKEPATVRNGQVVENGFSENGYIETEDGTLVMYVRWQTAISTHFGVFYSYDHGESWTEEPIESHVYSVNTNPVFYDWNDTPLLVWSGNNAFGGDSYRRMPVSLATFDQSDNVLLDPVTIQDMYLRSPLQGMDTATQNQATNPSINIVGDTAIIGWLNNFTDVYMTRIHDFSDFMYKTKGAYDSFEGRSMKYDGWSSAYGMFKVTDEVATHGSKSLFISAASVAGRSIGYMKTGTVSFDLYCEDDASNIKLELQNAFSNDEVERTSPVKVVFTDGKLQAGDTTLTLKQGWNKISFQVDMDANVADITVNDTTADLNGVLLGTRTELQKKQNSSDVERVEMDDYAVEMDKGAFISWVRIETASNFYLDNFLVVDNDPILIELESNGGIGDDTGSAPAAYWWIIPVVLAVVAAVAVVIVKSSKKKGASDAQNGEDTADTQNDAETPNE